MWYSSSSCRRAKFTDNIWDTEESKTTRTLLVWQKTKTNLFLSCWKHNQNIFHCSKCLTLDWGIFIHGQQLSCDAHLYAKLSLCCRVWKQVKGRRTTSGWAVRLYQGPFFSLSAGEPTQTLRLNEEPCLQVTCSCAPVFISFISNTEFLTLRAAV